MESGKLFRRGQRALLGGMALPFGALLLPSHLMFGGACVLLLVCGVLALYASECFGQANYLAEKPQ